MSTHRLMAVFAGVMFILTAGCGGSTTVQEPQAGPAAAMDTAGYPALSGDLPVSPTRRVSDDEYSVQGSGYLSSSGGFNRAGDDDSYILISNVSQMSWALYGIGGITGDRPVSLALDVEAAELVAGDGEPQPVNYWVGVGDYTNNCWSFFGGFTDSTVITINAGDVRERCLNASGTLHFIVIVPPTQSSSEYYAVQVNTGTATSSPGYLQNLPHFVTLEGAACGPVGSGHGTTVLAAEQHVQLTWTHVPAFGTWDEQNAADYYDVYRRGPDDEGRVLIGTASAPADSYTDPVDNTSGILEPVPGVVYTYWLQAGNEAGTTPISNSRQVTVPILPPAGVSATDGDYIDRVVISWEQAEQATGYQVFRDDSLGTPVAEPGLVTSWEDTGVTAGTEYTYWVKTVYTGGVSRLSGSDTGYAGSLVPQLDPPADVRATDGDYEDRVVLTWTRAENATGYDIFRDDTSGDPFATVGDVATWEDTAVSPGVVYTYWLRSVAGEYAGDLSDSDSGYTNIPGFTFLRCFPTECDPDTDQLSVLFADPVIRRNPKLYYDSDSGSLVPVDEEAYSDVLKTNGYDFTAEVSGGLWPKVAVVQTNSPININQISDGMPGILNLTPNPHRLTTDISVITEAGSPGEPVVYSFRVFNADGSSPGGGSFTVSPTTLVREGPVGIDWGINVWDRESVEIANRSYDSHIINGSTTETTMPDVLWVEFTGGWYYDWETDGEGVYGLPTCLENGNAVLRIANKETQVEMYAALDPVICGLGAEGAVIAIWWANRMAYSYYFPGWPGVLDPGETFSVSLDDPAVEGIEYTFTTELSVIGTNPNYL